MRSVSCPTRHPTSGDVTWPDFRRIPPGRGHSPSPPGTELALMKYGRKLFGLLLVATLASGCTSQKRLSQASLRPPHSTRFRRRSLGAQYPLHAGPSGHRKRNQRTPEQRHRPAHSDSPADRSVKAGANVPHRSALSRHRREPARRCAGRRFWRHRRPRRDDARPSAEPGRHHLPRAADRVDGLLAGRLIAGDAFWLPRSAGPGRSPPP